MNFSFFSPVKIIFGQGESENIFSIAANMGKKCLIVTGKNPDRCSFIFKGLE
ncbi:MAG: hypothetical protein U9N77_00380 [Thermodesulfobacteriota bacterium]|nr:hypothetical protein [Thermodesulfobacteriota bacterium]